MISRTRPSFWRAYTALDDANRAAARRAYKVFAANPQHPSLRFKKLGGYEQIWSVRINQQYRAVGERRGDRRHLVVGRYSQRLRQAVWLSD